MLDLCPHGRGVLFMKRRDFRRSGAYLQSALAAIEAYSIAAAVLINDRVVVDVMHFPDVDVVDRAVVIEVASAPVSAAIAKANIAKAIVHATIVADMQTPIAAEKSVVVMTVAPISRRP